MKRSDLKAIASVLKEQGCVSLAREVTALYMPTAQIKTLHAVQSQIPKVVRNLDRPIEQLARKLQEGISTENAGSVKRVLNEALKAAEEVNKQMKQLDNALATIEGAVAVL